MKPQAESNHQTGTDPVSAKLVQLGLPVTRENWIKLAWLGQPPAEWGPENEAELPPGLRQEKPSREPADESQAELEAWRKHRERQQAPLEIECPSPASPQNQS